MHAQAEPVAQAHVRPKTTVAPLRRALDAERGAGSPLDRGVRTGAERAFGCDMSGVRVHTGGAADRLSRDLGARAFTRGSDIFFRSGAYQPGSAGGRRLIAHELAHVVQQRGARAGGDQLTVNAPGDRHERAAERAATAAAPALCPGGSCSRAAGAFAVETEDRDQRIGGTAAAELAHVPGDPPAVQRDLAIPPTVPNAPAPVLTQAEIDAAVEYNRRRFHDPFTVMFVRDVLGVPKYPAVSDAALATAAARYQADFGLAPADGKIGPATTRLLIAELNAEDQRRFARLLRQDNLVTWSSALGPTWTGCGNFDWNVTFFTTLRGGWLIQRIDNTWNATACGVGGGNVTPGFTPRYWEAWWVDANGTVFLPTSTAQPPATQALAGAHDEWHVPPIAGSRGNWTQGGTMFTTLALPAGFAIRGANSAPEAGDLPSTRGPVNGDDLGLESGSRMIGGEWNCCDPNPANHFHRRR